MKKKYRVSSKRRHLYKLTYTCYDFYQDYNLKTKIDKDVYLNIIKDFFDEVIHKIVVDRKSIRFPYNLGKYRIQKKKRNYNYPPNIDYNKTKLLGKTIYHLNTHTMGNTFRWRWDKERVYSPNKRLYVFRIHQKHSSRLASEIFRCAKDSNLKDYDALL